MTDPRYPIGRFDATAEPTAALLESLGHGEFARRIVHPDHGEISLARLTALYGWHGRHHVAHVTAARRGMAA